MKKIIVLFVLLFLPILVFADDYLIRPFEAVVTADEGTNLDGKEKIHLNKDDKIFISLEFDKNIGGTYIDEEMYKVAFKDIKPVEEEVSFNADNVMDFGLKNKLYINIDSIDVYSGPSVAYKKVGTIGKDDELSYQYYYDPYVYIENDDIKGWINAKENNLFIIGENDFITTKVIKSTCGNIPINTIFKKPMVKAIDVYDVLVEYNDCRTIVKSLDDESMVSMVNQYIVSKEKLELHETPEKDSKVLDTIPKYTVLNNLAVYYQKFDDGEGTGIAFPGDTTKNRWYVEYNSVRGWINAEDFSTFFKKDEAVKEARKEKRKAVLIPVILIVAIGGCLLSFYISGRRKNK